jgi:hypothetical protein
MTDSDPAHAILYGLALGHALGWPVEFLELPQNPGEVWPRRKRPMNRIVV